LHNVSSTAYAYKSNIRPGVYNARIRQPEESKLKSLEERCNVADSGSGFSRIGNDDLTGDMDYSHEGGGQDVINNTKMRDMEQLEG
jgi:hypothetical protein